MNYYLGLDIGGTKIMYMLTDEKGNIIRKEKAAATGCLIDIEGKIRSFINDCGITETDISAMAMGVPGCVEKGYFISDAPALGWHNLDLTELFSRFNFKCTAANDVTCALYAECELGYGKDTDDILFISIGTGLGSAFKAGGIIIDGARGMSGEIGYLVSDDEAKDMLTFGSEAYGALERKVSGTGLDLSGKPFGFTAKTLFLEAENKNLHAEKIISDFINRLCVTIANCQSLLNPEIVVLGGGISNELGIFMDRIRDTVKRLTPITAKLYITELKNDAGAIGACSLARKL